MFTCPRSTGSPGRPDWPIAARSQSGRLTDNKTWGVPTVISEKISIQTHHELSFSGKEKKSLPAKSNTFIATPEDKGGKGRGKIDDDDFCFWIGDRLKNEKLKIENR